MPQNHILLETIQLTQSASTVTFDNLPSSGYTDLKIIVSARCTDTTENQWVAGYLNFNGVSTNLTSINVAARIDSVAPFADGAIAYCFWLSGSNSTSNTFATAEITIPNYLSTTQNKVYNAEWGEGNNSATNQIMGFSGGKWASNSAITSITLIPQAGSIAAGSTFSLYGIATVGTTPAISPFATGGNIVATDGTYWYHAFLSSGSFLPQKNLTCDVLIVGGGGSGDAAYGGGGGGAGGVLGLTNQTLTKNTSYTSIVGAGGASVAYLTKGNDGNNSTFNSNTAYAGQGGLNQGGYMGGRNGGASGSPTSFSGGTGYVSAYNEKGGGGGGAGGVGGSVGNGDGGSAGNGGNGLSTVTNWGSLSNVFTATNLGYSGSIAGGGGGGRARDTTRGTGTAGGGDGGISNNSGGNNAVANTGSGGGASSGQANSGSGASGLIIIRYLMAS
jgi:hypothetical protein